jgi:hypothetical protein
LTTNFSFKVVGRVASTTALLVGDLNGDGKVDIKDAKIASEKAKQVGPLCFIISCLTPINIHLKSHP